MNAPPKTPGRKPPMATGLRRVIYLLLGWFFVGVAALGVVLPLLPTTPFLLLAAILFARSSEHFYAWLLGNRHFGAVIRQWREDASLPLGVRIKAIVLVVAVFSLSIYLMRALPWLQLGLVLLCAGLVLFLLRLPERAMQEASHETDQEKSKDV